MKYVVILLLLIGAISTWALWPAPKVDHMTTSNDNFMMGVGHSDNQLVNPPMGCKFTASNFIAIGKLALMPSTEDTASLPECPPLDEKQ